MLTINSRQYNQSQQYKTLFDQTAISIVWKTLMQNGEENMQ